MIKGVCQNCPDRFVDADNGKRCHTTCEKYLEAKGKHDAEMKAFHDDPRARFDILTHGAEQSINLHNRLIRQARARGRKYPK